MYLLNPNCHSLFKMPVFLSEELLPQSPQLSAGIQCLSLIKYSYNLNVWLAQALSDLHYWPYALYAFDWVDYYGCYRERWDVHQESRVGISAAPVTQEIYQFQSKRRRLDLEISRISYPGMEISRGFLQFSVPGMILLGSSGIWVDERMRMDIKSLRWGQRKAWDVRQSGERGMMGILHQKPFIFHGLWVLL